MATYVRARRRAAQPARYTTRIFVTDIQRHRNGVSGESFYCIRFDQEDTYSSMRRPMLAVLFEAPKHCAVMQLEDPDEHYRGDSYEETLREAVGVYERDGALSSPAFEF